MWTRALKLIDGADLDAQRYADRLDNPWKKCGKYARNIVIFHGLFGVRLPWLPWHLPAGCEKWRDRAVIFLVKQEWDFESLIITGRDNQKKSVWIPENQTTPEDH